MKSITTFLLVLLTTVCDSTYADQYNDCDQGIITQINRESLWYDFRWDAWEDIYYPDGWIYVSATGPVTITPYSRAFSTSDPDFTNNYIFAFINESYQLPAIWTINGNGSIYRAIGGYVDFPNPGPVQKSCSGGF